MWGEGKWLSFGVHKAARIKSLGPVPHPRALPEALACQGQPGVYKAKCQDQMAW